MYKRKYLPSLTLLRSFECAARHESFTMASKELHLTQSAISRQVKELEELLNIDLFRRVGRRVLLTKAGRAFASDLSVDLERIRRSTLKAVSAGQEGNTIHIATLPSFASKWLIPRLPKFELKHPNIEFSFTTLNSQINFKAQEYDVAIGFGDGGWPDTEVTDLGPEDAIVVATPQFCSRHGITNPDDICKAPILHLEDRPTMWPEWFEKNKLASHSALVGKRFNEYSMLISATLSSLGSAIIPSFLIDPELRSKQLIWVGGEILKSESHYYVVKPSGATPPHLQKFVDWLERESTEAERERSYENFLREQLYRDN